MIKWDDASLMQVAEDLPEASYMIMEEIVHMEVYTFKSFLILLSSY